MPYLPDELKPRGTLGVLHPERRHGKLEYHAHGGQHPDPDQHGIPSPPIPQRNNNPGREGPRDHTVDEPMVQPPQAVPPARPPQRVIYRARAQLDVMRGRKGQTTQRKWGRTLRVSASEESQSRRRIATQNALDRTR